MGLELAGATQERDLHVDQQKVNPRFETIHCSQYRRYDQDMKG